MLLTRPGEDLRKEMQHQIHFVFRLLLAVGGVVGVVGLVPEVPGEDARVVGERSDHSLHISLQARILRGVGERGSAGALRPSGVVDAGYRWMLRAKFGIGIPA